MASRKILLSFDVEEFDMPLEYTIKIAPEEQLQIGGDGFTKIRNLIDRHNIATTLFTTAHFANHFSSAVAEAATKHEIASHTYYHSDYKTEHLLESRLALEKISGTKVTGLRMPRLKQVPMLDVINAGYNYDSSMNPTWIPGRYNHLRKPRRYFTDNGMLRIPASVSAWVRFPLFWLSFKNVPLSVYTSMAKRAFKKDGYLCLYFHPWEFVDINAYPMPGYTRKPCGDILLERLDRFITSMKKEGDFVTMQSFAQEI
jgi:peptidoglycan/xylan/chitin deacetylase (PgdA/CDA1 family)